MLYVMTRKATRTGNRQTSTRNGKSPRLHGNDVRHENTTKQTLSVSTWRKAVVNIHSINSASHAASALSPAFRRNPLKFKQIPLFQTLSISCCDSDT